MWKRIGKNMRITNNIFMLETTRQKFLYQGNEYSSMVYAVLEKDGVTLIDTGFPTFEYGILEELRRLGRNLLPLKQILLTHGDLDHIGNAAWLQEKTGCPVWIDSKEAAYFKGGRPRIPAKEQMCRDCGLKVPRLEFYPDTGRVGDFQIIDTPGHTVGHVCVLYQNILFGGDLFSITDKGFCGANPAWTEDMKQAENSLEKLKKYKFSMLCPAHGMPDKRRDYL